MVAEQSRYLEEASKLDEQVQQGNIKLESLEHQIGEIQKQIEELTGGGNEGF